MQASAPTTREAAAAPETQAIAERLGLLPRPALTSIRMGKGLLQRKVLQSPERLSMSLDAWSFMIYVPRVGAG